MRIFRVTASTKCSIFDLYNSNLKLRSNPTELAVDDHIIKYFECHGDKHFIGGKPIRYGFEAFGIVKKDGFLYHVEPSWVVFAIH